MVKTFREQVEEGTTPYGYRLLIGADLVDGATHILDLGCGDGALARLLDGTGQMVIGVDRPDLDLDTQSLPYQDATFDAVTCLDVIEHVMDPRHLLAEIMRVLRPGGKLVLVTPNIRHLACLWTLLRGRFPVTSLDPVGYDGGHIHYFTYADIETLCREAGFSRIERFHFWRWNRYAMKWFGTGRLFLTAKLAALLGSHLQREFFSSSVVVRVTKT